MAWRNFPILGMEDLQGEITDFSLLNRLRNNWTMGQYAEDFTFKWLNLSSVNIGSFIFGDSANGLKYESQSGGDIKTIFCQGYLNGSAMGYGGASCFIAGRGTYPAQNYYFTFYCCVDDSTQKACLFALTASVGRNGTSYNCDWANVSRYINSSDCYQLVTGFPIITNTWQSVASISGKNGISLLSIIKSNAINGGDAVTGASEDAFDRLEETTKISTLIQGISEETPIIYSDDVNYMSITPTANNTCTLKFYLHGSVIYTLTNVSINAYLSFLIDETNGIMKPSIIYEDS